MREEIVKILLDAEPCCPEGCSGTDIKCEDCPCIIVPTDRLLALFTASQAELKEESSARLDILQFMTDWVENHICEITAMREALQMARQYIQEAVDEGIDDTAEADLAKIDTVLGGK